jgi:glycosyltransferase involved in cell wall biosynthesis
MSDRDRCLALDEQRFGLERPRYNNLHASPVSRSIGSPRASGRRHICVVTETYPPEVNGVALTLGHLVRGLLGKGHAVSMVRPRQKRIDRADCQEESSATLVRGLPLPGYRGLQFGLPAGRLLRRSWLENPPDVVYVATEGPLGWSAIRCARRLSIPTLSGFHTNYHRYSQHYHVGWLQPLIFRYLRWFHNLTAATLVPCEKLRDRLHSLEFKNVSCLGRGVDSQLFHPQRRSIELRRSWGLSDSDLALLYVGRVAAEKNLGLAVDAYCAMKRLCNSVKFVIVGDGPLCSSLRKAHADLIFCGMQTGEQLARHYASADVFLFPSETETFGNVTLEAMASGLAVIAYDYAAAGMHIMHGETGFLAPYGDPKSFLRSAVALLRDAQSLGRIRRRAREYVAALNWQDLVERFEMLLFENCHNGHATGGSLMSRRGFVAQADWRM